MRFFLILLAAFSLSISAEEKSAEKFIAGIHYEEIANPLPKLGKKDTEVIEFFWYSCPHCYQFALASQGFKATLPEHVEFRAYPAYNPRIEPLIRAFFVGQFTGLHAQTHLALFEAIHKKRKNLNSREALQAFFSNYGLSRADFDKWYDSFAVSTELRRSARLTKNSELTGVPSLVVAGKYLVSTGSAISTYGEMFAIVKFLIEKAQADVQP